MTEQELRRAKKSFGSLRDYNAFAVEWQKATGRILMSDDRTKELGIEKMEDADKRVKENNTIGERNEGA